MSHRVVFTPEAEAQLSALYHYVAAAGGAAVAERFVGSIVDYCEGFATFPHRGTQRDDLHPGLRTVGFRRRATIAFEVAGNTVNIVGVFYGGQDFETVLRDMET